MSDLEDLAIVQCAKSTQAFVSYIQIRDKTLSRAEATAVAAAVLDSLPTVFSSNEFLLQSLDRAAAQAKASARKSRG